MYCRDHAPPHFHAIYGDFEITVEIASGAVNGDFPRRALAHVKRHWESAATLASARSGRTARLIVS